MTLHYEEAALIHKNSSIHSYFRQLYIGKTEENPKKSSLFSILFFLEYHCCVSQTIERTTLQTSFLSASYKKVGVFYLLLLSRPNLSLLKNKISTFVAFRSYHSVVGWNRQARLK